MSDPKELSDDDRAWNEGWNESSDDEASPAETSTNPETTSESQTPEPDPESGTESSSPEPADPGELDKLKQKLRSAEGRFSKFEEHIDSLKSKISDLEVSNEPQETPDKTEPLPLPDGWTKEDWDDFEADYPVQAELLSQQNRQVQQLKDRVDHSEQMITQEQQAKEFNESIRKIHPDYDELLSKEREQIVSFIKNQTNPTLKTAYEYIYQQGDAAGIINLVSDYKANGRKFDSKDKSPVNKNVDNALAVPGRSPAPANPNVRAGIPDQNNFEDAWNYFSDESLD